MVLTDTEKTEYQRRGFFVRYGTFSEKECLVFREAAQRVEAQLLEEISGATAHHGPCAELTTMLTECNLSESKVSHTG